MFQSFGSDPNGGHCEYDATADNGNNVMITVGSLAMIGPGVGDPVPDGSLLPGTLFVPLAKIALSNL